MKGCMNAFGGMEHVGLCAGLGRKMLSDDEKKLYRRIQEIN